MLIRLFRRRLTLIMAAFLLAGGVTIVVAVHAFALFAAEIRAAISQDLLGAVTLRREQIEKDLHERLGDAEVLVTRAPMASGGALVTPDQGTAFAFNATLAV